MYKLHNDYGWVQESLYNIVSLKHIMGVCMYLLISHITRENMCVLQTSLEDSPWESGSEVLSGGLVSNKFAQVHLQATKKDQSEFISCTVKWQRKIKNDSRRKGLRPGALHSSGTAIIARGCNSVSRTLHSINNI